MDTKEIEDQMESIADHLHKADQGRYPTGNLIIAITKLATINQGLLARIEQLERAENHGDAMASAE